jgi:hypothetical protein
MAKVTVAQALELVEQLDADGLRQIRQAIDGRLNEETEAAARDAFHEALLASGLVKELKPAQSRTERERPLVPIEGRPLSETILEERR